MSREDAACRDRTLEFDDPALARELFGASNTNLSTLSALSDVDLHSRGTTLTLVSDDEAALHRVADLLVQLYGVLKLGFPVHAADVEQSYSLLVSDPDLDLKALFRDATIVSPKKTVSPKSLRQREYIAAMRQREMVFGIGPAGTGKTYLAVAAAVAAYLERKVKRIVLTRPAVEAGEKLGFLPGDLVEKINPYLRPLYDALYDMLDKRKVDDMLESGVIEIAPLAFMRGRTLSRAFIILDEAQNTTPEQMKMFLTRMGQGSRVVVTGDVTQIDLPRACCGPDGEGSGLVQARRILKGVEGIAVIEFEETDVVRHPLVGRIVAAYDRDQNQ